MFGRESHTQEYLSDSPHNSPTLAPLPESDSSTPSIEADSQSFRSHPIDRHLTQGYLFPEVSTEEHNSYLQVFGFTPESTEASDSLSSNQRDLSSSQSIKSSPSPPKSEPENPPVVQHIIVTPSHPSGSTPNPTITTPNPIGSILNPVIVTGSVPNPTTVTTSTKPKSSSMVKTIADLPVPGSKNAPKKFTGKYSRVKRFTDHVKKLIEGVTGLDGTQKCRILLEYCSTKVADFLERLNSFKSHDFNKLVEDIHMYYDADLAESKWKEKDLMSHIREYRRNKIKTLSEWKAYNRRFIRIANWLKDKTLIDDNHYKTYFWDGIHKELQAIFETRIMNKYPGHDYTKPYDVDKVQEIANKYFQRDKFASLIADSDDSDSGYESFESTDSEDSSSSSDDSDDDKRKKKKKKKLSSYGKYHVKSKHKLDGYRKKIQAMKEKEQDESAINKKDSKKNEVDELIDKLQNMSIDHPSYGITYYRAIVLDGRLKDCLKKPQVQPAPADNGKRSDFKQFKVGQRVFQISPSAFQEDSQPQRQKGPSSGDRLFQWDDKCYGCGGRGHTIRSCQKITELLNEGVLLRNDNTGHITMYNGEYIRK